MKKILATTLLVSLFAAPTFAQPLTYTVDGKHTFPRFSYSHLGFSTQQSRFNKTTGTVTLDTEAKSATMDITIDMTSVDTGSELFNEHIQEADFFDTANYPTATFKSTKVTFEGDAPTAVEGELTIKGITRPVTLKVVSFKAMPHPMLKKPAIGANATTTVKRSDFKAGKHAPAVSDEVSIDLALEAIVK